MLLDQAAQTASAQQEPQPDPAAERSAAMERSTLVIVTVLFGAAVAVSYVMQALLPPTGALAPIGLVGAFLFRGRGRLSPTVIGGLAWCVIGAAATVAVLHLADSKQHNLSISLLMNAVMGSLLVVAWLRLRIVSGASPPAAVAEAARPFTEPISGAAATLIGAGVAFPLVGAYAPFVTDTDSGWIVASTLHVRENGLDLLHETQEVLLPFLTFGPLLAIGGYGLAVAVAVLSLIALSALTAYLGYRLSGRGSGALAASVTLLSIPTVTERVDRLPMYAGTFLLAYGAGWLLHRAMADPQNRQWLPVLAGLGFAAAYEAHALGQIFLAVPFLLLLLHPWRQALRPLLTALATTAVALIPRLLINLPAENLSELRSNRADFLVQQGYLHIVNRDFNGQNVDVSPLGYLTNVPHMAEAAIGGRGMLFTVMIPITYAALRAHHRARMFAAAATATLILLLAVVSPATYARYLTPLAVGVAIVVAVGLVKALKDGAETLGRIMTAGLTVAAFLQVVDTVSTSVTKHETVVHGPWPKLAAHITDDRAVLGVRSFQLLYTDPTIRTVFARTMPEDDFTTFLSWPDDEAVAEVLDRHDVGWMYVTPSLDDEIHYHQTWLLPTYGHKVRHIEAVLSSDQFCLVAEEAAHLLFRYGDCRPGDLTELPSEAAQIFSRAETSRETDVSADTGTSAHDDAVDGDQPRPGEVDGDQGIEGLEEDVEPEDRGQDEQQP